MPEFLGGLSPKDSIDWIDEVERVFEYAEVPEEERVPAMAMRLNGHAFVWWKNLDQSHKVHGKRKIDS